MFKDTKRRKVIRNYIISIAIIIMIAVVLLLMYKYNVEGEKKMAFNISKIVVISSAQTKNIQIESGNYKADVIQKNDIYLNIQKNIDYNKEDAIKKITFNNFSIINKGELGNIKIYRPSKTNNIFEYKEEFEITDNIVFIGDQTTDLTGDILKITNQGGAISFSIIIDNLGNIIYSENENIATDGTLLNRLNLSKEDLKATVSFDMIMELDSGNTFKTTITLELPEGNIFEEGVSNLDKKDLDKLVFKRV